MSNSPSDTGQPYRPFAAGRPLRHQSGAVLLAVILWCASAFAQSPLKSARPANIVSHRKPSSPVRHQVAEQRAFTVDAGDAYMTPHGARRLLRLAGAIVVQPANAGTASTLAKHLTGPGGILQNYREDFRLRTGAIVFKAPLDERKLQQSRPELMSRIFEQVRPVPGVRRAGPLLLDWDYGLWLLPGEEILVRLKNGVDAKAYFGPAWPNVRPLGGTTDQFVLPLGAVTVEELLRTVNQHAADPRVAWSQPDFISQEVHHTIDPFYAEQWYLRNTGQTGAQPNADVHAPEAWNITTGSSNIVIAIVDDAVQITHPDLAANIFSNPNEIANGVDDDANGYTDDLHGWDVGGNDNNPNPSTADDNHGTETAGIAAAVGQNGLGVAGIAYGCRILPVTGIDLTDSQRAESFYYAAGRARNGVDVWRGADIISFSIGRAPAPVVDDALHWAATSGRGGKGCAIFVSSGNDAADWGEDYITVPNSGTHTIRWEYYKDESLFECFDTVWLDSVTFTDGSVETFEGGGLPAGWSSGPSAARWQNVQDGVGGNHAVTGWNGPGSRSLRAGLIGDDSVSYVEVTRNLPAGDVFFWYWVSSEYSYDTLDIYLDGDYQFSLTGCVDTFADVSYPASHPDTIAVGASTDFDFRADFSEYGSTLDLVAPGGGGRGTLYTTDRTGLAGDDSGNFYPYFAGTSASCPLAAGVGALVLSVNPELTAAEVRAVLRAQCDQIGAVTYPGGRNDFYGYGRVNAFNAVSAARLRITAAGPQGSDYAVSFNTLATRSYRVERSDALGPLAMWTPVAGAANVPGTGGVVQVIDSGAAGQPARFYRVRQLP